MCGSNLFSAELRQKFDLPLTDAFNAHTELWGKKLEDIDGKFDETPAMRDDSWKRPRFKFRDQITRGAALSSATGELSATRTRLAPADSAAHLVILIICIIVINGTCSIGGKPDRSDERNSLIPSFARY